MPIGDDFAGAVEQEGGGVEIEVGSGGCAGVPTETDEHRGHSRCLLGEGDVAAFGECDCHGTGPFVVVHQGGGESDGVASGLDGRAHGALARVPDRQLVLAQRSNSVGAMPTAWQASVTALRSSASKLPSAAPMIRPMEITARA